MDLANVAPPCAGPCPGLYARTRFSAVKITTFSILAASVLAFIPAAVAQFKNQTPAGEAPGQWIFGTIGVGKGDDPKTPKTTALKGLAIKVGANGEAAVAYDLDLCRMVGAWTGKFTTPMNLMSRGEYPTALGDVVFTTAEVAGFQLDDPGVGRVSPRAGGAPDPGSSAGPRTSPAREDTRPTQAAWRDPRDEPFGPLPDVRFKGMFVNGGKTVLKWDVAGTEVLEMPGYEEKDGVRWFVRNFEVAPHSRELRLMLIPGVKGNPAPSSVTRPGAWSGLTVSYPDGKSVYAHVVGEIAAFRYTGDGENIGIALAPANAIAKFAIKLTADSDKFPVTSSILTETEAKRIAASEIGKPADLSSALTANRSRWPETIVTEVQLAGGADRSAIGDPQSAIGYVVDTIKLPDPNPWSAPMFIGGFDFFDDGRAALCTFHGDVFVADGFALGKDAKVQSGASPAVTWRRVASGLYHALGLKVVKGEIYVTCRDGIYRLKDLNGDGETDFYEVFNNDVKVTKNFHEFVFDLHTDQDGYFYFAKAGPVKNGGRGFDEIMKHHGTLLRVTPDGKKMEVMATGFRAPNGIGIGPNGEMTSGDNEGTWTPMCRLNWIKPGGFYGVVDLAQRKDPPTDYDRPLCWFPKKVDNSSGSQVWVPENDRWGPWRGQLLHLSYGQCLLYGVLKEETIDANAPSCCQSVMQGGVVQFPGLKFESGIMRARFHPIDGQLYVAGLRGWQTSGIKNGCFQRVRYTGAPVRMPIAMHAKKDGIELQFTSSLDTQAAADTDNWNVQAWNYIWSSAYGSPEISTTTPLERGPDGNPTPASLAAAKKGRDTLAVASVKIGTDDRTVFLEIPDLKPAMQIMISYQLKSADGVEMKGDVVGTIHVLGEH
jgi:hypothetical protein